MKDDHSLGVCVGLGAQMINGCTNNPFTVLAKQVSFKKYKSYSDLFFLFYPCLAELSANYISHLELKIPNTISSFKLKKIVHFMLTLVMLEPYIYGFKHV